MGMKTDFINRAKEIHEDKYDYSKVSYVNTLTKVCIICPEHGEFWQTPNHHLYRKQGCPKCKNDILLTENKRRNNISKANFECEAKLIHGNKYDYSKFVYINNKTKGIVICPKHGEFKISPNAHFNGNGCPLCGKIARNEHLSDNRYEFIWKAIQKHGYKYDYRKVDYINSKTKVCIICPKHGEFWQTPNNHIIGSTCPTCSKENIGHISDSENELFNFIKETYSGNIIQNDRTILKPNELDIYIPELNLAFEFDGLYWHNELNKPDKNYHLNKTNECLKQGIRLVHIFEDEWLYKKNIVKSIILNLLDKIPNKIFALNCKLVEVSDEESKNFLNENHLQGYCNSNYRCGLYYNDELLSLMTFGNQKNNGYYELLRFVNKCGYSIIGSSSRLLNHFIKKFNPIEILSYVDRRYDNGDIYKNIGFKFEKYSQPDYYYVVGTERKEKLLFDEDKNYRIYDCGCEIYKLKNPE